MAFDYSKTKTSELIRIIALGEPVNQGAYDWFRYDAVRKELDERIPPEHKPESDHLHRGTL